MICKQYLSHFLAQVISGAEQLKTRYTYIFRACSARPQILFSLSSSLLASCEITSRNSTIRRDTASAASRFTRIPFIYDQPSSRQKRTLRTHRGISFYSLGDTENGVEKGLAADIRSLVSNIGTKCSGHLIECKRGKESTPSVLCTAYKGRATEARNGMLSSPHHSLQNWIDA